MAGVPISKTVLVDYLNLKLMRLRSRATGGETSDFHRNVRTIHIATGRSTISVFHGRLTQRAYVCMFYAPCRDISLAQGGTKDLGRREQTAVHTKAHQGTSEMKPLHCCKK